MLRELTLVLSLLILSVFWGTTNPEGRGSKCSKTCWNQHVIKSICTHIWIPSHTPVPATVMIFLASLAKEDVSLALRVRQIGLQPALVTLRQWTAGNAVMGGKTPGHVTRAITAGSWTFPVQRCYITEYEVWHQILLGFLFLKHLLLSRMKTKCSMLIFFQKNRSLICFFDSMETSSPKHFRF